MTARARFTQADVTRVIKAAKSAGFESFSVVIERDGTIELRTTASGLAPNDRNEWVDLE